MSETKPEKRLVSKKQYVRVMGKKAGLYSSGGIAVLFGSIGLGLAVFLMVLGTGAYWLPFISTAWENQALRSPRSATVPGGFFPAPISAQPRIRHHHPTP